MGMGKEIVHLVWRDLLVEWRKRRMFAGVVLYTISTIFVCYLSFGRVIGLGTWNALFWIIVLFASFNVISRDIAGEGTGQRYYLYQLASPRSVILARILYNAVVLTFIVGVSALFYSLFIGQGIFEKALPGKFILALVLASVGLSSTLTLIGAIASKGGGHPGMTAVLGFPVVLPFLTLLIRFSRGALEGVPWSGDPDRILVLLLIGGLVTGLSYILFPYIWKD